LRSAGGHSPLDRCSDRLRDLVLDGEYVLHVAIVVLRPQLGPGGNIDNAGCHSDTAARCPNAALDDVLNIQLPPYAAQIVCLTAVLER
jgi:hypothetical protein